MFMVSGCTHVIVKEVNEKDSEFYDKVEKLCNEKDLTIKTKDYEEYKANNLMIHGDTSSFLEKETKLLMNKNNYELSSISFQQSSRGAFEGFLYGTISGGGLGLLFQFPNASAGRSPKGDVNFIIYSAAIGAVIGTVYGLLSKSTTIIEMN